LSKLQKDFIKLRAIHGWLLDIYPLPSGEMIVWVIGENGERVRLVDKFSNKIYVSGDFYELKCLVEILGENHSVADWRFVEKYTNLFDNSKSKVLEIGIRDYRKIHIFAKKVLRLIGCEKFNFYNIDVPPSEAYLYDKDIFPLARVIVVDYGKKLWYKNLDSVESVDYSIPPLRFIWLSVSIRSKNTPQKMSDGIDRISIIFDNNTKMIDEGSETEKILELVKTVEEADPDIIYTSGGDSFLFPYLSYRAFVNGILDNFLLGRENIPLMIKKREGKTIFSYGRTYRKEPMQRLYGRIHIDIDNAFIHKACGLEGLIEASRNCRIPLHRAARATIGRVMSSMQLYTAWKEDILIPWKKREPESFKTALELLVADRGGFVFEPKLGIHTSVAEVDFTSMFPMLMLTKNISAETILCKCCPGSKSVVPELGYNICEKRRGIVPRTLDLLLKKRLKYKHLMGEACDERTRQVYNMRQNALKWIMVTCFGYLGYRNSRFGSVDAHISVCAFAREILLKVARMAEKNGFEVIHGIVDSLWLKKKKYSMKEIMNFCSEVSKMTNIPLGFEGVYRWIVFLPSKIIREIPVLNRYYGIFENGEIKIRGIEARCRDAPNFIRRAQMDMIKELAITFDPEEFKSRIPEALKVLRRYADKLICRQVDINDLIITKRISKPPSGYTHNVFQAIAAKQLEEANFRIHAGDDVQYLIVDSKGKRIREKVLAAKLLKSDTSYDVEEYLNALISAAETLFGVFGYTKKIIRDYLFNHNKQVTLSKYVL
jgi:DNA polymerase I